MKNLKSVCFAMVSLLSVSGLCSGDVEIPRDLEQLKVEWDLLDKNQDSKNFISVTYHKMDESEIFSNLQQNFDREKGFHTYILDTYEFASRDHILGHLFPKGAKELASFCEAFPEPKIRVKEDCTPEEESLKLEKAKFNRCKNNINKKLLGGVFQANPKVYFGKMVHKDGSMKAIFYVSSFIDATKFLRYEFNS